MLGEERPSRPAPSVSATMTQPVAAVIPEPPAPAPAAPAAPPPKPAPPQKQVVRPGIVDVPKPGAPKAIELKDFVQAPAPRPPRAAPEPARPPDKPFAPPTPPPPPSLHGRDAFDAEDVETVQEFEQALNSLDAPLPEPDEVAEEVEIGDVSFAESKEAENGAAEEVKHVRVRSNIDILAELEKLRRNATAAPVAERPARRQTEGISIDDLLASSLNHRKEINRVFELEVPSRDLARGHQVTIGVRLEDKDRKLVTEEKSFSIELHTRQDIEKLLLSLKFHILGK
jgi:hypothetical protein